MFGFAKRAVTAALLTGLAAPAIAADLVDPVVPPPPVYGGWYIRGYLGMTNQALDSLDSDLYRNPAITAFGWFDSGGFDSSPLFGLGGGYKFNDYLRGDLTVEYRGAADFSALDWKTVGGATTTNDFTAQKSEWLMLANAYVDVGTYWGVTPYFGAGIGASRNTISHFRDINVITSGAARADSDPTWNLAWALHAGLGIQATDRMTVDLGYSFVSLGDARTGTLLNDDPTFDQPNDGFRFNDLISHDLKLGVRYMFY
jgi:opacity protein-like surface antigen